MKVNHPSSIVFFICVPFYITVIIAGLNGNLDDNGNSNGNYSYNSNSTGSVNSSSKTIWNSTIDTFNTTLKNVNYSLNADNCSSVKNDSSDMDCMKPEPRTFNVSLRIIGLFSICGNSTTGNVSMATELHYTAVNMHLGILYGLHEENLEETYDYEVYDVCEDEQSMLSRLVNIILDPTYTSVTNYTTNMTYISCIFSYMTEHLTRLAANILTGGQIPMVSFNNHPFFPSMFESFKEFVYIRRGEPQKRTDTYFKELLKTLGYDFPFVVSLNENYGTHEYYENLVASLIDDEICVVYQNLKDLHEIKQFMSNIEKYYEKPQVLLMMTDALTYRELFTDMEYVIILFSIPFWLPVIEIPKDGTFHKNATKTLNNILKTRQETDDLFGHNINVNVGQYEDTHILVEFQLLFDVLKNKWINNELKAVESNLIESIKPEKPKSQRKDTSCTNFKCGPGYERKLQRAKSDVWKNKYSYVCVACRANFVKSSTGEGKCQPCYGKNISNTQNTQCYVPYQMRSLKSVESVIALFLNSIGMLFCFVTFILFERFRKTPVVRASDTKLSEIQLLSAISLFLFMLLSATLKTTEHICKARPACIGFFFSLFISVTLAKAEKPLTVFLNRKKLTKKDINVTEAHQYLIIIILPLISLLMTIISFQVQPADVIITTDDIALIKTFYCNTDHHVHVQAIFIFSLLMTSLAQAYRSRKIPDNYSEAMTILYSTFTCSICLVILFPIYQFQREPSDRMHINWIVFCVVGLILSIALYGPKVITILFYPERNTVRAFRKASTRSMDSSLSKTRSMTLEEDKSVTVSEPLIGTETRESYV